jgi:hypothetical protein
MKTRNIHIIGNAYIGYAVVCILIIAVLINVYLATQNYNSKKRAENNATVSAFLNGKTINCIDGGREDDISISKGWEYRNDGSGARFKKDGTIFLPSQCKILIK